MLYMRVLLPGCGVCGGIILGWRFCWDQVRYHTKGCLSIRSAKQSEIAPAKRKRYGIACIYSQNAWFRICIAPFQERPKMKLILLPVFPDECADYSKLLFAANTPPAAAVVWPGTEHSQSRPWNGFCSIKQRKRNENDTPPTFPSAGYRYASSWARI